MTETRRSHLDDVATINVSYKGRPIDAHDTTPIVVPGPPDSDDESVWFMVL